MSEQIIKQYTQLAYKTPRFQCLIMTLLACVCALVVNFEFGLSLFLGGALSFIANYYLVKRLFSLSGARKAKQILYRFLWAEAAKLLFIGIAFIVFLQFEVIQPLLCFIGFCIAQLSAFFMPLLLMFDFKRE